MKLQVVGALALATPVLAGCGSEGADGTASLWVTRDRGARVLLVTTVPAGLTAMQALRRKAEVKTRYGGRFVVSIDGVRGSLSAQRDWFYFVNGVEADRGAAEYRLHRGDVEWWDYRSWRGRREVPVVVGAFPEPFLHGYGGKTRAAAVRYRLPGQRAAARRLARTIGAVSVAPASVPVPPGANVLVLAPGSGRFSATATSVTGPYTFTFAGDAAGLAREPRRYRYRYSVP